MDGPEESGMVDVAFALGLEPGGPSALSALPAPPAPDALPRDHRRALAAALQRALPWLQAEPLAGVHRLNVSAGGGVDALLSRRTRLTLRVPRARADAVLALSGALLELGALRLRLGAAQRRELLPNATLYAHFVAADPRDGDDELAFLRRVHDELQALGVPCRTICGRPQAIEAGALHGYSLMLDGLSRAAALRVLQTGVGAHRSLGCGLFVPHRSAAAVGAPA